MQVKRLALLAAAVTALMVPLAVSAPAMADLGGGLPIEEPVTSPVDQEVPDEVRDALARWSATGVLTAEDRATLLKFPEIASQLVEPAESQPALQKVTLAEPPPSNTFSAQAAGCKYHDRYIVYNTLLGFKAFEWHHKLYYCIDKSSKVKRTERGTYLVDNQGLNHRQGYEQNTEFGNNTKHYSSAFEEKIRNCIPDGKGEGFICGATNRPYSKFVVNGGTGRVDYYYRKG
jgi:hypothetical protein